MPINKNGKQGKPTGPSTLFKIQNDVESKKSSKSRVSLLDLDPIGRQVQKAVLRRAQGYLAFVHGFPDSDPDKFDDFKVLMFRDTIDDLIRKASSTDGSKQELEEYRVSYFTGHLDIKVTHDSLVISFPFAYLSTLISLFQPNRLESLVPLSELQ